MRTLIIAEHDNQHLNPAILALISAAQQLTSSIDVLIIGCKVQPLAQTVATIAGVSKVLVADAVDYTHHLAENSAYVVVELAKNYQYILAAATTFGKNLLPRVAALVDVSPLSDIIRIIDKDTFVRPIYAGNALATVQSNDTIKVLTIRPASFEKVSATQAPAPIENLSLTIPNVDAQFISHHSNPSERPDLSAAEIVVSGGRGMQSGENFSLLIEIADKLGAAIGASRAAVDAGFVPNDLQVGQTGKIIAPKLYIAVGISGAIQHLAGMKDSKVIVAINKDPDAPIFQIADYGLVGDLFEILPQLSAQL